MRKTILLLATAAFINGGCSNTSQPTAQNSANADKPLRSERAQSMTEHTLENKGPQAPAGTTTAPGQGGKWSQSGNPIDTKAFDDAIAAADKALSAKPTDTAAKNAAAEAYFKRGFALTEARQYASALGDLRKALKLDPSHAEAKKWENQIIGIYEMMKKDYPKPGEEPPPLPWKG